MKMPNVTGLVKVGKTFIQANRPEILFGGAIVATLTAVGLAAKGGYEAGQLVLEAEHPSTALKIPENPLTSKEKIQLTWLCYMPAMVSTVAAVGSTTGLHIVHLKDKKMMAQAGLAALEEVKASAKQYEKDVKEAISENATPKAAEKIEDAIEEKKINRLADQTMYTVQDAHTGRAFYSSESRVQEAINQVNNLLNKPSDVDLNYFYIQCGVPEIDRGDEIGWSGQNVHLKWDDTHLEDGRPARKFTFQPRPRKGFDTSDV